MSPEIRMYFPLTPTEVGQLHVEGQIDAGLIGFVVDDSIRDNDPDGDADVWEFRALQRAASHARRVGGPVVVAAADVCSPTGTAGGSEPHGAMLNHPLGIADVVCLHLGDDALGQTALPVPDGQIDLSWFDKSEVAQVVRHLSPPQ